MEDEQPAPTLDAAAARKFCDATAARALKQPLDGEHVRERQTAQAAATAREPLPQRPTPQRRHRSRQHLYTQRPRAFVLTFNFRSRSSLPLLRSSLPLLSRRHAARLFEQLRREAFERVGVFAQEFGGARERLGGARVEGREQRQESPAHAHAREALVLVHLVLAELDAALAAEAHC